GGRGRQPASGLRPAGWRLPPRRCLRRPRGVRGSPGGHDPPVRRGDDRGRRRRVRALAGRPLQHGLTWLVHFWFNRPMDGAIPAPGDPWPPLVALDDPYPVYRRLRDEAPVYHDERLDLWALSRFDDVQAAAKDWRPSRRASAAAATISTTPTSCSCRPVTSP